MHATCTSNVGGSLRHGADAGGGAVEAALSIYLENFATTLGSREQLAIAEVADALLVIPKALAVNAAKDATELVKSRRSPLGHLSGSRLAPCGVVRLPQA